MKPEAKKSELSVRDRKLLDMFVGFRPALKNPMKRQPECKAACQRLMEAKAKGEKILVYGDFDCDGVTSVTLMRDALRAIGFRAKDVACVIPDRINDGYDLKWSVIERHLKSSGSAMARPKVVIAVDCGTTARVEVEKLLGMEMTVMVVDHHEPDPKRPLPSDPPGRLFHINPKLWLGRPDREAGLRMENMCAAGLTYLLARALISIAGIKKGWNKDRALLLAGLATCVDVMELTGLNRSLLKHSIRLANKPQSLARVPGLAKLKERIGPLPRSGLLVTEETYGFYWGPCLNAAGRMAQANAALKLLGARTEQQAAKWVNECLKLNRWRKAAQKAMIHEATLAAKKQMERDQPSVLALCHPTWHPDVVGIVASHVKDLYNRPAIVGTVVRKPTDNDFNHVVWRASGRSVPGCHLGDIFHEASSANVIKGGGGHAMAGGLEFSDDQKPNLHLELSRRSGFDPAAFAPSAQVVAPASSLSPKEWAWLFRRLAPFGNGNPCPALIVEAAELLGVRPRVRISRPEFFREAQAAVEAEASGQKQSPEEASRAPNYKYWEFSEDEIRELVPFRNRLVGKRDPVSAFLIEQMDTATVGVLMQYQDYDRDAKKLRSALTRGLNQALAQLNLSDFQRFPNIKLRTETQLILKRQPQGRRRLQLNRLLLEDAYPAELARRRVEELPRVWAYQGLFEDKITGRHFSAQWLELEEAEMLWQPHLFLDPRRTRGDLFCLPNLFRLQLELRVFVPIDQWSKIYQGRRFERDYCFQIRQCIPVKRASAEQLRMRMAPKVRP